MTSVTNNMKYPNYAAYLTPTGNGMLLFEKIEYL